MDLEQQRNDEDDNRTISDPEYEQNMCDDAILDKRIEIDDQLANVPFFKLDKLDATYRNIYGRPN